jgi:hypothetical protein
MARVKHRQSIADHDGKADDINREHRSGAGKRHNFKRRDGEGEQQNDRRSDPQTDPRSEGFEATVRDLVDAARNFFQRSRSLPQFDARCAAPCDPLRHPDVFPANQHLHSNQRDAEGEEGRDARNASSWRQLDQREDEHDRRKALITEFAEYVTDGDLVVLRRQLGKAFNHFSDRMSVVPVRFGHRAWTMLNKGLVLPVTVISAAAPRVRSGKQPRRAG